MTRARSVLGLLVVAGCGFDPKVPNAQLIACSTDAECPSGLVCQGSAHHCVPVDQLDTTPPSTTSLEERLLPHFDNPLAMPTALGPRSTLRVRFGVSEPVLTPSLTASGVTCEALPSSAALSFDFDCVSTATGVDGPLTLKASLVDLAGLTAEISLALTTPLDVTSPPAPDGAPGRMRLRTSRWGDAQTQGTPSLRFSASDGVAPDAVRVQVLAAGTVLGSQAVSADAGVDSLELPLIDSEAFAAQSIDRAGNVSPTSSIRDVVWVASFYGKQAGDAFPNPHRFEAFRAQIDGLDGVGVTERGEGDGIATAGGAVAVIEGAGSWRRRTFQTEPDGTGSPAGAYDARRARVVRFSGLSRFGYGGLSEGGYGQALLEWNGHDWISIEPADPEGDGNPEPRRKATMVYSAQLGGVVLYSGATVADRQFGDTWLWNGVSWRRLGNGPPSRVKPILYEDRASKGVMMYSGELTNGTVARDAWLLTTTGWRAVDAGGFPTPRIDAAFANDTVNDVTWVYGGSPFADLWKREGSTWSRVTGTNEPAPRTEAAAAWDDRRRVMMMYGGQLPDGGASDELWELDGTTWKQRNTSLPGRRTEHTLVYDGARAETLLFGNRVPLQAQIPDAGPEETWAFSETWHLAAHQTPGLSTWGSRNLVYNESLKVLQTVGLAGTPPQPTIASLQEEGWQLADAHSSLLPVIHARIAYERIQDDVLLFGAPDLSAPAQVWRVNGTTATMVSPDAGLALEDLELVINDGLNTLVVTNVGVVSRLQRYVAGGLVQLAVMGPRLLDPAATFSPDGDAYFSGFDILFNPRNYRYSGTALSDLPDLPVTQAPFALVYDIARRTPVMPGGIRVPLRGVNDVYELRGAGWSRVPVADPDGDGQPTFLPEVPDGGIAPSIGYDAKRDRTILLEPRESTVWEFDVAHQRPQVQLRFSLDTVPAEAVLESAILSVTTGATGGVTVSPRMYGYWSDVVVAGAGTAGAPALVTVRVTDPAVFRSMLSTGRELSYAVRPALPNGTAFSEIAVDAAELEVKYRLP